MAKIEDFEKIYRNRHSLAWQWKRGQKDFWLHIFPHAGGVTIRSRHHTGPIDRI